MRVAFLGTPQFAVLSLDALVGAGHDVTTVVAQPDRPAGRGQALREPATKVWARAHGVPVLQPEKVRDGRLAAALAPLELDALIVAAYGRILGEDLLTLTPYGAINVHASLLPKYRGAAPVQWAIAQGETETGVTIMQMDTGLDTGDILLQRVIAIHLEDTAETLLPKLATLGGAALVEALGLLARGEIVPVRQDPHRATIAPVLGKEDGRLDFALPAQILANRIRAFTPWPGAFTTYQGKILKVHRAFASACERPGRPGEAVASSQGWSIACGDRSQLTITELQLEGKRRMAATEFLKGIPNRSVVLGT